MPNPSTPLTSDQFAQSIKAKYPQYANVDNNTLTQKMLAKYPQYATRVQVTPAPVDNSPMGKFNRGEAQANPITDIVDAAKSGINQSADAIKESQAGRNPIETGAKFGAGVVNTLFSPLAPLFKPVGQAVNAVADKISNIPAVQKFANSKAGAVTERAADLVQNLGTIAGAVAGGKKAGPAAIKTADAAAATAKAAVDTTKSGAANVKTAAKSVLQRSPEALVTKRTAELTNLENSSAPVRKAVATAKAKGIDTKALLAQTDLLHGAVDDTGTLRTQNAIHELNDFIKPQESVISTNLAKEGVSIPVAKVRKSLTTAIDKSGLEGDALESAYNKLEGELKGLSRRADDKGNIPLSKVHDAKVSKYANLDYANPASKKADKAIARAYKTLVEDHTSSVDAKALNQELAQHYAVLNLLEKLDGKKVEGGRLGKYFARTIGAVVGGHFGPLGSIVGAEVAGKAKGAALSRTLRGKTGAKMEQSDAMKAAVTKGNAPQLLLPPAKPGTPRSSITLPAATPRPTNTIEKPASIVRKHVYKDGKY
jgi:hypothetical protein